MFLPPKLSLSGLWANHGCRYLALILLPITKQQVASNDRNANDILLDQVPSLKQPNGNIQCQHKLINIFILATR